MREVLYEGTRGPGKTDALIMDYAQHVGQGFGADWNGIIFRRTFPELKDVIKKSNKWFPLIFPKARYNKQDHCWTFPEGEKLWFGYIQRPEDYNQYHGHEYPFLGFEELTNWASDEMYLKMFSLNRSSRPGVPLKIRATCNPYGPGHNWVKKRFRLKGKPTKTLHPIIREENKPTRIAIHGHLLENKLLHHADPTYMDTLRASSNNPAQLEAWIHGNWDVTSGGMFDDLWNWDIHQVPDIPASQIPEGWKIDRAYDHGQSKPFSLGWYAESDGNPILIRGRLLGAVKGDLFRIGEWYGWNGKDNEGLRMSARKIAQGIKERGEQMGLWSRCQKGYADSAIFNESEVENGRSVAGDMREEGVKWRPVDKRKGSRKQGWQKIRDMLEAAVPNEEGYRENPGFFVTESCEHFFRTFVPIPRDEKDPDDVNTDVEDHIADEVRYRCRAKAGNHYNVGEG